METSNLRFDARAQCSPENTNRGKFQLQWTPFNGSQLYFCEITIRNLRFAVNYWNEANKFVLSTKLSVDMGVTQTLRHCQFQPGQYLIPPTFLTATSRPTTVKHSLPKQDSGCAEKMVECERAASATSCCCHSNCSDDLFIIGWWNCKSNFRSNNTSWGCSYTFVWTGLDPHNSDFMQRLHIWRCIIGLFHFKEANVAILVFNFI